MLRLHHKTWKYVFTQIVEKLKPFPSTGFGLSSIQFVWFYLFHCDIFESRTGYIMIGCNFPDFSKSAFSDDFVYHNDPVATMPLPEALLYADDFRYSTVPHKNTLLILRQRSYTVDLSLNSKEDIFQTPRWALRHNILTWRKLSGTTESQGIITNRWTSFFPYNKYVRWYKIMEMKPD